jgi:hypothetical protein
MMEWEWEVYCTIIVKEGMHIHIRSYCVISGASRWSSSLVQLSLDGMNLMSIKSIRRYVGPTSHLLWAPQFETCLESLMGTLFMWQSCLLLLYISPKSRSAPVPFYVPFYVPSKLF